jgi:hypothetical protein
MEHARYKSQIAGLAQYSKIADIPPDPYDIDAVLARKLLSYYVDAMAQCRCKIRLCELRRLRSCVSFFIGQKSE